MKSAAVQSKRQSPFPRDEDTFWSEAMCLAHKGQTEHKRTHKQLTWHLFIVSFQSKQRLFSTSIQTVHKAIICACLRKPQHVKNSHSHSSGRKTLQWSNTHPLAKPSDLRQTLLLPRTCYTLLRPAPPSQAPTSSCLSYSMNLSYAALMTWES